MLIVLPSKRLMSLETPVIVYPEGKPICVYTPSSYPFPHGNEMSVEAGMN